MEATGEWTLVIVLARRPRRVGIHPRTNDDDDDDETAALDIILMLSDTEESAKSFTSILSPTQTQLKQGSHETLKKRRKVRMRN
jgi:hypothetical protein